ncbi:globin domain-containing protein [Ditylenchus destructor]|nr:globin domain-containing protein [Ditylenchus destructor]
MGSGASKSGGAVTARRPTLNNGISKNHTNGDANGTTESNAVVVDRRLPYANFRELFNTKNYWKTVKRNEAQCAKMMFYKYLKTNPDNKMRYPKLKSIDIDSPECSEQAFEAIANSYLKIFDDVINSVEETPADATQACQRLSAVGKTHRIKVSGMKFDDFQQLEGPFLYMIQEILQDRYNDKAENLFRKFFQFCLKYIVEGFNS